MKLQCLDICTTFYGAPVDAHPAQNAQVVESATVFMQINEQQEIFKYYFAWNRVKYAQAPLYDTRERDDPLPSPPFPPIGRIHTSSPRAGILRPVHEYVNSPNMCVGCGIHCDQL